MIVEAGIKDFNIDMSMGTHFFHNLISLRIGYLSIPYNSPESFIDWDWLFLQKAENETRFVKHIKLSSPFLVKIDGRKSQAAIYKPKE